MVLVEGGTFELGSPDSQPERYPDEGPQRKVSLVGFYLGATEVTVAEFRRFAEDTGYVVEAFDNGCFLWIDGELKFETKIDYARIDGFESSDQHPIVCVNSRDAAAYAEWLSQQTGKRYRLATEAEWEYAAAGGAREARFWGDNPDDACRYANVSDQSFKRRYPDDTRPFHDCDDGYGQAAPVAQFEPNGFGLFDMLGNVWEWTCSENGELATDAPIRCADADSRAYRVFKGGAWYIQPRGVRVSHRNAGFYGGQVVSIGFRVLREQ